MKDEAAPSDAAVPLREPSPAPAPQFGGSKMAVEGYAPSPLPEAAPTGSTAAPVTGGAATSPVKKAKAGAAGATRKGSEIGASGASGRKEGKRVSSGTGHDLHAPSASRASASSGLKASLSDDNKQFNYFLSFLKKYQEQVNHYPVKVDERIVIRVKDEVGKPLCNAEVRILDATTPICSGRTYADGSFLFFPAEHDPSLTRYRALIHHGQNSAEISIDRDGKRDIEVSLRARRPAADAVPLDILFILDTTGSMGNEINRLKNTIEIINLNLAALPTRPRIRFGMVEYRDRGDEYVTKVIDFTENLDSFHAELETVRADGGGDTPEDMQAALADAMKKMKWNSDGIRLGYLITDAPPHLDYGEEYTYVNAMHEARGKGIKIFSVGTGSLDLMGEYIMRQISQYTSARYIFLTHGETGESEGGRPGSVSHHTGANYQTDRLESIIIRLAKEELAHQSDQPLTEDDSYFEAVKRDDDRNEEVLRKLFDMSIAQLVDYATIGIDQGTPATVIPLVAEGPRLKANAEYFASQLLLSLAGNKTLKLVDRDDLQKLLGELKLQQSGLVDEAGAVKLGKLVGAKVLLTGRLYEKSGEYEAFLKLLRVETAEVLAVTKLRIDGKLGVGEKAGREY